jgi:hypothetical protein
VFDRALGVCQRFTARQTITVIEVGKGRERGVVKSITKNRNSPDDSEERARTLVGAETGFSLAFAFQASP